jgi:hypothetical protein
MACAPEGRLHALLENSGVRVVAAVHGKMTARGCDARDATDRQVAEAIRRLGS